MKKNITTLLIIIGMLVISTGMRANEVKINGFVAQGLIQAADSNFVTDDDEISFKSTEIGINSSYRVNADFRLAGQVVYLNGGNRYAEGVRLDYLFVEWQLLNQQNWQLRTHIGRNKNYHWLYSSTRDVPHTRPSIVLPQSLYFDTFRDVALGVDGIAVIAQTNNTLGEWDINLSLGKTNISDEQKENLLGPGSTGKLSHDTDKQMSVFFRPSFSHYQFGLTLLDADFSYQPGENDQFVIGDVTSQRFMLNLLYQGQHWEFASEIMHERVIANNVLFAGYDSDITSQGGYFQARYFLTDSITLLSRLDIFDRDYKNRNGSDIEALSQGRVPSYFGYMDQATLGMSWQLADNIQLQSEFHRVKGAARLAPIFTPDVVKNNQKYWNMWAVQLMYWF